MNEQKKKDVLNSLNYYCKVDGPCKSKILEIFALLDVKDSEYNIFPSHPGLPISECYQITIYYPEDARTVDRFFEVYENGTVSFNFVDDHSNDIYMGITSGQIKKIIDRDLTCLY